ncbi:hypothetical protein [Rhizobium sp. PL01]|uniref:hypothetical protein n=1 Tax=Rhizobium sp. PL01 TaxID=3085631 RepID=UPI002982AD4B|nr:hypothetical protein [Rhizobium sp. PL01]MDW5315025.1 hypothetical protein [Rhizobium sp. PL01]
MPLTAQYDLDRRNPLANFCRSGIVVEINSPAKARPVVARAIEVRATNLSEPVPRDDGTVASLVVHVHMDEALHIAAAIPEWKRVLAPGGFLVCSISQNYFGAIICDGKGGGFTPTFTAPDLLGVFESALPTASFKLRHVSDDDDWALTDQAVEANVIGEYRVRIVYQMV